MKIIFSPFAETDLTGSIQYYNEQKENLGNEFFQFVSNLIDRIKSNPKQFPIYYKKIRRANTYRFPFSKYFTIAKEDIFILAVFHNNRNPKTLNYRL